MACPIKPTLPKRNTVCEGISEILNQIERQGWKYSHFKER